jgi:hypothetical protein
LLVAIDVGALLEELKGNFRGAVFLTYTLDLGFFEQLIAPKLDALGCTNVVILSDRHGYDEALARHATKLTGVGRRYLCVPIHQPNGSGVQHVKAILLVGPEEGCLLLGSGNLTLHGIGRNLEQFTRFDFNLNSDKVTKALTLYPFRTLWNLVRDLQYRSPFSDTSVDRLDTIAGIAPWIASASPSPEDTTLWNSFDRPLLNQFRLAGPVEELQIISPLYSLQAIKALLRALRPKRLILGVDAAAPNVNGPDLVQHCEEVDCQLRLRALEGKTEEGTLERRPLHAKTFIGISKEASWCASGSANCSARALLQNWQNGGNLELLVWQRADDPHAFDQIWQEDLVAWHEADPTSAEAETEIELPIADEYPLQLVELNFDNDVLRGRFTLTQTGDNGEADPVHDNNQLKLELLRLRKQIPLAISGSGMFSASLAGPMDFSEAGRLVTIISGRVKILSTFRWVDQPRQLERFGHRSYHARVGASLQTFAGSGTLFEELMNFLWDRVNPQEIHETDGDKQTRRTQRRRRDKDDGKPSGTDAPPPEAFITEETLSETLTWRVGDYMPHDRSTLTLRDLLSLTLLRLTTETSPSEVDPPDGQPDDDPIPELEPEQEEQRISVLQSLRRYLRKYCRRYAQRLTDADFVVSTGPQLLFENHYTLGRVLLEFAAKVELFTDRDLRQNTLWLLSGFFWPNATGLAGRGAWPRLAHFHDSREELREQWKMAGLTALTAVLIVEGWGEPPKWDRSIHRPALVQRYLLVKELLTKLEEYLGEQFWHVLKSAPVEEKALWGFRNLSDLESGERTYLLSDTVNVLDRLRDYWTPVEEKYWALFTWQRLRFEGREHSFVASKLIEHLEDLGHTDELMMLKELPATTSLMPLKPGDEHCPRCSIRFPAVSLRKLKSGGLALCPQCTSVIVYRRASLSLPVNMD